MLRALPTWMSREEDDLDTPPPNRSHHIVDHYLDDDVVLLKNGASWLPAARHLSSFPSKDRLYLLVKEQWQTLLYCPAQHVVFLRVPLDEIAARVQQNEYRVQDLNVDPKYHICELGR